MGRIGEDAIKRDKRGAQSKRNRINEDITGTEVRLIGSDGEQVGIVTLEEALKTAQGESLDLVEIAVDSEPPVCRVMDYGKHIFDEKKSRAEAKKKQKKTQVKEIKFRPGTEEGDYQVKLRNLTRFLSDGDKAKVTMRFRGREMAHQDIGMKLLKRVEVDLEEIGSVEMYPKMEGRQMTMVIAPRKKK